MEPKLRKRIESALERRYGKSLLPLSITPDAEHPSRYDCTDRETGAFIKVAINAGRIRVLGELGPSC
jgi:hypothetical protein